jgi:hypothetical protein
MIPIITTAMIKYRHGTRPGNICLTPNGTRVTRTPLGYLRVNKRNAITSYKSWYVENDQNGEIWQTEATHKNGEKYIKTIIKKYKRGNK